jgi:hypothetical protein
MKSLKSILLASVVAFAVVNMAHAKEFKAKPIKAVNIVFAKAVTNPGLVVDMYKQLDPSFLQKPQPLYLVKVVHNKVEYRILGNRLQFISFFKNRWKYLMDENTVTKPGS